MALDKSKTDPVLGQKIHELLVERGLETPMKVSEVNEGAFEIIENSFRSILEALNMDISDDSLSHTPRRIAKMYTQEIFWGLNYNNFPKIMTIENKMEYDNFLIERGIKVHSVCEHHFVPIVGEAVVAYIPNGKVVGLSKLNRVVEYFSRRPQVQERLSEQIWCALSYILDTENLAVMIRADHFCVKTRGIEDENSDTITSKLGGAFFEGALRNEFYQLIKL